MGAPRGRGRSAAGGVHSTSVEKGAGGSAVVELPVVVVVEVLVADLRVGLGARRPGAAAGARDVQRNLNDLGQSGRIPR